MMLMESLVNLCLEMDFLYYESIFQHLWKRLLISVKIPLSELDHGEREDWRWGGSEHNYEMQNHLFWLNKNSVKMQRVQNYHTLTYIVNGKFQGINMKAKLQFQHEGKENDLF